MKIMVKNKLYSSKRYLLEIIESYLYKSISSNEYAIIWENFSFNLIISLLFLGNVFSITIVN